MLVESQSVMSVPNARPRGLAKAKQGEPWFRSLQGKSNGGGLLWPRPRLDVKSGGVRCQPELVVSRSRGDAADAADVLLDLDAVAWCDLRFV